MSNKDNDDDGLLGWCAMRPIVLPAGDSLFQTLIDSGRAIDITNVPHLQGPETLVVQPRHEYVFNDVPTIAKLDMRGLAEAIATIEARNATKH